jgi:hypothetical protein
MLVYKISILALFRQKILRYILEDPQMVSVDKASAAHGGS